MIFIMRSVCLVLHGEMLFDVHESVYGKTHLNLVTFFYFIVNENTCEKAALE